MVYKSRKQLQRLSNKQIFEDVKKYIKSSHTFYETRVPELKVLAKRLHEEYDLKKFYRVFNKLWNSGYHEEKSLAIHTLQLYKDNFDLETWKFLKQKLKDIKSWDKLDSVSINITGEILIKNRSLEKDIFAMTNSKNIWLKRMGIMSTIPLIKINDTEFPLKIIKNCLYSKEEPVQNAIGKILKEISEKKPAIVKSFILKNIHMPITTFNIATENMKELRRLRNIKPLKSSNGFEKLMFWKNVVR